MNSKFYPIKPQTKPRMTQRDKWLKPPRPEVARYRTFVDLVGYLNVELPENYHIIFLMQMPKSKAWSDKKRKKMFLQPHMQTPDKDNIEKGLLDALFSKRSKDTHKDDAHVWDGRCTKVWSYEPGIIIEEIKPPNIIKIVTKYYVKGE